MCEGIDTFWVFFIYVPELPKRLCSRWISPEDCPHFILPFPVLFLHSLKGSTYKSVAQGYGITRFIMLHFIALHKHCVFTNWRFVAVLHWAILSALFFPQHSLTWCLCVTFQYFSKYFKLFHYYYICYGDLWSVIFVLGCHKLYPYKTGNLIDKHYMCSGCSTNWPIHLSPSPQASLFPAM